MVANCANPACNTRFKYSSQGKLFSFELVIPKSGPPVLQKQEWFWLVRDLQSRVYLAVLA
jgi:hypothetical protein